MRVSGFIKQERKVPNDRQKVDEKKERGFKRESLSESTRRELHASNTALRRTDYDTDSATGCVGVAKQSAA